MRLSDQRLVIEAIHAAVRPGVLRGTAAGFYRQTPVPVVQLVWPDRDQRWRSDEQASPGCRAAQLVAPGD
ncbi:DUF4262 domain-containing protein [Streptomyces virginiae]|uniref:DUF4262 domain-containing protein n=1 Tax=Streptomyces virginiae TaxID=1961 RepID=UPI0035DA1434